MRMVNKPLAFALLVGTRGFFNAQLAREGRTDILKRLAELGYGSVILPDSREETQPESQILPLPARASLSLSDMIT